MGVDYYYCGECQESMHDDCFPGCNNESCSYCGDKFEHSSGHGYYCADCGLRKKIFIQVYEEGDEYPSYYCNKKCQEEYEKDHAQWLIDRETKFSNCATCKKDFLSYKCVAFGGGRNWCSHKCYDKYYKST